MTRYLYPSGLWALRVLGLVCAVALLVSYVGKVHEVRALKQQICAERLMALKARNPFIERYLLPAEPCQALALATR